MVNLAAAKPIYLKLFLFSIFLRYLFVLTTGDLNFRIKYSDSCNYLKHMQLSILMR